MARVGGVDLGIVERDGVFLRAQGDELFLAGFAAGGEFGEGFLERLAVAAELHLEADDVGGALEGRHADAGDCAFDHLRGRVVREGEHERNYTA